MTKIIFELSIYVFMKYKFRNTVNCTLFCVFFWNPFPVYIVDPKLCFFQLSQQILKLIKQF